MLTETFSQTKADAFADKIVNILNCGSLALVISIGHRTGLFDSLSSLPPSTSQAIAHTTRLSERYVREWLGAMVTGGIISYDPTEATYHLPKEHAAFLTRAAAPDNLAVFAQYISVLGQVEDKIIDCFLHGGGVPYEEFHRFHQVMAEDSGQTVVAALEEYILPLIPGLVNKLKRGIDVLDVGCGSGRAIIKLAKLFPDSNFVGFDFSSETITRANQEVEENGLSNVQFKVMDATQLQEENRYDLITTFDAVHDQADPATVLRGIARALKVDGIYLMQDIATSSHVHLNIDHPIGPFLYTISTMHCMTVSLAQGGAGLGTCWGKEKAIEMLHDAGFNKVDVEQLAHDIQNYYYIVRKV